ncbi:predicted protein [Naegleria gruberi]|uniref:Predicted protein n=1 Tax=Naegleria gruberi TaxID=5762 RepID=D2V7W1_NAEGR|nr:uncharacterized protein NAEGRDRAFT_47383 [Naegleria gruberi]EFC46938.1 predicted protein [Naegleria gruberi]|eukprot:XP_002679682.1 predicted protein [Naegleria gruberi strain NEG-M]
MEFSPDDNSYQMNPVHFESNEDCNFRDMYATSCAITNSKYLVIIHVNRCNMKSETYQEFFTSDEVRWMLVDLNSYSVKRVYPIVYNIEKLKMLQISSDGFQRVEKRPRTTQLYLQDGDLNGGRTDSSLINRTSISQIRINDGFEPEFSHLFAFRPFQHNPELFQVHLSVSLNTLHSSYSDTKINKKKYGHFFRFYFKFSNEATCILERLLKFVREGHFSDVSISIKE